MGNSIDNKKKSQYKSIVPAVDQGMQVLHCLATSSRRQLTLTEICQKTNIHKSKGYTILNTLMTYDFIEKNPQTKTYKLGLGIVYLARNVIKDLDIRDILTPHLRKLAQAADATAHYGMISGDRFYIVAKEESDSFGYSMRVGVQHHITHGAHGKAILASLPEPETEVILSKKNLHFYGDGKPVDLDYLKDELTQCRELGYAVDLGETNPNIIGISSVVMNADNSVIGAVVLIGVFQRSRIKTFGPMVNETARNISARMI